MRAKLRDRLVPLMAGAAATSSMLSTRAIARPVYGADFSGKVEYSKNPFLSVPGNTSAARFDATVSPYVEIAGPRSQFRLIGSVSHSRYSRIYDPTTDYSLNTNFSQILSSRLSMHANAGFTSNTSGNYAPENVSLTGIPNPLPAANDVTLLGSRARYVNLSGALGFGYTANPRNSFSLDYSASVARQPDAVAVSGIRQGEYNNITQQFGYSHVINARLSIGASMGVNRIDYLGTSLGDATVLTPNLNASWRLFGKWAFSGGIGVSILRQNTFFGRNTTRSLSASLSACRSDSRDSFCFSGSRGVSPSSLGAARTTTSLGVSYNYRVNARDSFSANGNFEQSDDLLQGPVTKINYLSGGIGYRRQFNNRFSVDVSAGFSRGDYLTSRSDARVGMGISYHLDNRR